MAVASRSSDCRIMSLQLTGRRSSSRCSPSRACTAARSSRRGTKCPCSRKPAWTSRPSSRIAFPTDSSRRPSPSPTRVSAARSCSTGPRPIRCRWMFDRVRSHLLAQLEEIRGAGLEKKERGLTSPQGSVVSVQEREVLNLCANNYLGLADDPAIVAAAKDALDRWGYGMASVRFICGTQAVHKELEAALTDFLGTEDTILYSASFDAKGGIFEALLDERDAIISDSLNHASIIDGIRLCKARRLRYANRDMADLERQLQDSAGARFRMVVTDGVFSMDGYLAPLPEICHLAERYDALVMVDDSHAGGFWGEKGRGHN